MRAFNRTTATLGLIYFMAGCSSPMEPAPPLDIRGEYDVTWFVGYVRPDGNPALPDTSLPRGTCNGTMTVDVRGRTIRAEVRVPDGVDPPCYPATFTLTGTMQRVYGTGDYPYDFGWDVYVSGIDPMLGCTYVEPAPGNSPGASRGVGRFDTTGGFDLSFGGIYECGGERWWIVAGAGGHRRG